MQKVPAVPGGVGLESITMSLYIQQIYRIYRPSSAKQSAIYQPQSSTAYPTTISPERPKLDRGRTNAEGSRGSG